VTGFPHDQSWKKSFANSAISSVITGSATSVVSTVPILTRLFKLAIDHGFLLADQSIVFGITLWSETCKRRYTVCCCAGKARSEYRVGIRNQHFDLLKAV
jgi:hypothetical protein